MVSLKNSVVKTIKAMNEEDAADIEDPVFGGPLLEKQHKLISEVLASAKKKFNEKPSWLRGNIDCISPAVVDP